MCVKKSDDPEKPIKTISKAPIPKPAQRMIFALEESPGISLTCGVSSVLGGSMGGGLTAAGWGGGCLGAGGGQVISPRWLTVMARVISSSKSS